MTLQWERNREQGAGTGNRNRDKKHRQRTENREQRTENSGLENPEGPHAGDMKNFTVKPDGTAKVTVDDPRVTLGDGANSIFTGSGTALMIHAKADDMKSDPAGNAGDRIACGTITK